VETARAELKALAVRVGPQQLRGHLRQLVQRTDELGSRIALALRTRLAHSHERLRGAIGRLESLSPLRVLERGYSITQSKGRVLRETDRTEPGDVIHTTLWRGRLTSRVEKVEGDDGKEKAEDPGV